MIISCDWGTSSFRLRLVDNPSAGSTPPNIRSSLHRPTGIAATFSDWQRSGLPEVQRINFYRTTLQNAIDELQGQSGYDLRGFPVILSGMASSSIGMLELPYHSLPFNVTGEDLHPAILPATPDFPQGIVLMPGICSENDVMRGEETQLIGCYLDKEATDLFVFPGTHSKHIHVFCGQAVHIKTFMTGEFFALLSRQSILAASIEDSGNSRGPAFFAGVDAAQRSGLLNSAFSVRTNQLFAKWSKTDNYQYLSGLLIGEELKGLTIKSLTLVAGEPLLGSYRVALRRLGVKDVTLVDADQALVQGHCRLFERFAGGI
jgi:2-dehydro-3-deoxygalactonokinase